MLPPSDDKRPGDTPTIYAEIQDPGKQVRDLSLEHWLHWQGNWAELFPPWIYWWIDVSAWDLPDLRIYVA